MKRYVGHIRRRQGQAFTTQVSDVLRSLDWCTETNIEMSSLGAPAELGDIDVLAWHRDSPRILAIECKSLIPRGNTYEVVEELLAFRGEAQDRLGRHVSRIEWIIENSRSLLRYVTHATQHLNITPLFVTNRNVPMRYVEALPVPPDGFLTIEELDETLMDV